MTLQEIQYKAQAIMQEWRDEDSAPYVEFVEELALMDVPELPEGLDEAARFGGMDHVDSIPDGGTDKHPWNDHDVEKAYYDGMLAGAEWMAGQGETRELIVARGATENYIGGFVVDENKFHSGEEVIVQIKKK